MRKKLTDMQLSALKEVSNIGAGHAATALSEVLSKEILISTPFSGIVPGELFLKKLIGGKDKVIASVYLQTLGDVSGAMIHMMEEESAIKLSDAALSRNVGGANCVDEAAQVVLKELTSILTGAFFTVLADMLDLEVFHKAPAYIFDRAESVINDICAKVFGDQNERFCIYTEFIDPDRKVIGSFIFVPTETTIEVLLKKVISRYEKSA